MYFWKHIMFLLPDGLTPVLENTVAVERGLCGKCIVESTHLNPLANYSVGVGGETCGTILMFSLMVDQQTIIKPHGKPL